jgi:PAS domain-containing protein
MEIFGVRAAEEESVCSTALCIGAIHPEDAPRVIAAGEDLAQGRLERYDLEYRQATRDGSWKWVRARARAVAWNPDGTVRRVAGTLVDVSRDSRAGQSKG